MCPTDAPQTSDDYSRGLSDSQPDRDRKNDITEAKPSAAAPRALLTWLANIVSRLSSTEDLQKKP